MHLADVSADGGAGDGKAASVVMTEKESDLGVISRGKVQLVVDVDQFGSLPLGVGQVCDDRRSTEEATGGPMKEEGEGNDGFGLHFGFPMLLV
tara:strand:- start:162 stop:440 length:279 start_codon:yes stop_codon:yes gene_type:complete